MSESEISEQFKPIDMRRFNVADAAKLQPTAIEYSRYAADQHAQRTVASRAMEGTCLPGLILGFDSVTPPTIAGTSDNHQFASVGEIRAVAQSHEEYRRLAGEHFAAQARECELLAQGSLVNRAASPYCPNDVIAQGFKFPNPVDAYKSELEHHYRGKELETMNKQIPTNAWDEAFKAFPELRQLGRQDVTMLMKAIVANELDHYGKEDLAQDAIAKTGHGGGLHRWSIGFGQISPDGVKDMVRQLDGELKSHERTSNPLARFEYLNNDQLAQELVNPANTPLLVAAHIALDLKTLNRRRNELRVSSDALGFFYNADMVYARSDKHHEHLLTKKEAQGKSIPFNPALPTDTVLRKSGHAANIRKWLQKVH